MDPGYHAQATTVMQRDNMASMPAAAQLSACLMVRRPRHRSWHGTSIHPLTAYTTLLFVFSAIGLWSLMEIPHESKPLSPLSTEMDGRSFSAADRQIQSDLLHQINRTLHERHLDQNPAVQSDVLQQGAALSPWPRDTNSSYTEPLERR